MMHDRVPRKVYVLGKTAPQVRRLFRRGIAVADTVGVIPPVGVFAMTVLATVTPFAFAAHDIVLDEHQVALLEALAPGELAACLGDIADVFVAHDYRALGRGMRIQLDVGAADAG